MQCLEPCKSQRDTENIPNSWPGSGTSFMSRQHPSCFTTRVQTTMVISHCSQAACWVKLRNPLPLQHSDNPSDNKLRGTR